jgi:hypothetical protein
VDCTLENNETCASQCAGQEVGRFLVSAMPVAVMVVIVASEARGVATHRTADQLQRSNAWRESAEQQLLQNRPGYHVIFVRYTGMQSPHDEWIYNRADIDSAPVIWAQDMGPIENERLLRYYAGRSFWLFKPDESMGVSPYESKLE